MKILILAAGRSSRFKNRKSKVLMNFWGARVIDILIAAASKIANYTVILNEMISNEIDIPAGNKFIQNSNMEDNDGKYGTGAAIRQYIDKYGIHDDLLIIPADAPLIDSQILKSFQDKDGDIIIGAMNSDGIEGHYGRIIEENGEIIKIAEYKFHQEKTPFLNTGIIYIKKSAQHLLHKLKMNEHNEIYLTDIVQLARENFHENNLKITKHIIPSNIALGFNTIEEFVCILNIAQNKWRKAMIENGAILHDVASVFFAHDTQVEPGVEIEPYAKFLPGVILKENAYIKSFSVLANCIIDGVVGPFAHIKSGDIAKNAQIGAFVEISKSQIEENTKIKHLSYIGNAKIGKNVNIGAGVVLCNYDGKEKHETIIKDNAFIGANSALIAPIMIAENALLAAGGVYNEDVGENELAIARTKQSNKQKR